ncbi:aminotransferase class I/II-fold pyridoxal phosphate-dependent enzyme [Methylobacterium komagatae]|uniref:Aminotransferase n=1 Tax=Methylobacterium komagatae TaxID=374425 RepID=A0ABW2BGU1_9HYPH
MREPFALANFLSRWVPSVRHDLASSDSETTTLSDLLDLAGQDDLERWHELGFGYLDPRGAEWLRHTVAARHERLAADDVVCCAGAQEALAAVVAALLTPHDHAVVVLPIYQPSEEAVTALCTATGVALRATDGWCLDVGAVEAALRPQTKLVLMNMPNSPTGATLDAATMDDLVALCRRRGLWLVSDEVYRHTLDRSHGLGATPAVADLYERGISIDSLSKGYGLAGLRVGWIACRDRRLLAAALNAKNRMSSSPVRGERDPGPGGPPRGGPHPCPQPLRG